MDIKNNKNLPAYPISIDNITYHGLTKRELFAAMAMQGLLSSKSGFNNDVLAKEAILTADVLLEEINK